jgi:hypothetical protein
MATFSKKAYQVIADALGEARITYYHAGKYEHDDAIAAITNKLAHIFERDNTRFDMERFMVAAGRRSL